MAIDKYSALWVSHTSMSDFLACPRSYFLRHMYRDPKTRHKIKLMSPSLALGQAVHEVLESLSVIPKATRFLEPIMDRYDAVWAKVSGKRGGFFDRDTEYKFQTRGRDMIRRVLENPGPVAESAVKIKEDLPYFWLSEEEGIILCGKIDWLEYLTAEDAVHIIDFKTGKQDEDPGSLQLPIYHLLVSSCQQRPVKKASYWYLERDDAPTERGLPGLQEARDRIIAVARQIKLARQLDRLKCPSDGCFYCQPFEAVVAGKGELVGTDNFGYDIYILPLPVSSQTVSTESTIL